MLPAAIVMYEHNIRFLQSFLPELFQKLASLRKEEYVLGVEEDGDDYLLFYNGNIIKNSFRNGMKKAQRVNDDVELLNRYFVAKDKIGIDEIEDRKIEKTELAKRAEHFVVFGFLPAFHIESVIDLKIRNIYFVEPDFGVFLLFLHLINLQNIVDKAKRFGLNLHFIVGESGECSQFLKYLVYKVMNRGELVLGYFSYQSQRIEQLKEELEGLYTKTSLVPQKDYFTNIVSNFVKNRNLESNVYTPNIVQSDFDEMIVLVGSGSSLDQHLDFLKNNQENLHIFALSSAFRPLVLYGIEVDYLFMIDPLISLRKYNIFDGVEERLVDTSLIGSIVLDNQIMQLVRERNIAFFDFFFSFFRYKLFSRTIYVNTVLTFALNFLLESGFKRIALVGVDLGTKDAKNFHSRFYEDKEEREIHADIFLEGNFGDVVFTTPDFLETKRNVDKICKEYLRRYSDIELINFSDGARLEFFRPEKDLSLLKKYSIENKRVLHEYMESLFSKKLADIPKNMQNIEPLLLQIVNMKRSLRTKNLKKFKRALQTFLAHFADFGLIHPVYEVNFLAKINFRLNVSKEPQKLFMELLNDKGVGTLLENLESSLELLRSNEQK